MCSACGERPIKYYCVHYPGQIDAYRSYLCLECLMEFLLRFKFEDEGSFQYQPILTGVF